MGDSVSNAILTTGPSNSFRSEDIWYPDGSIVLVAGTTAYRVHTSILAQNCEVFKNMATIPRPLAVDEPDEMYEDCPVVRLQDEASDLEHFLKAMYNFRYFRPDAKTTFPVVSGILRLSTKYMAHELRKQAIDVLATAFPADDRKWSSRNFARLVPYFPEQTSAMISLCLQTGARVLLPAVYYAASKLPLAEVLADLYTLPPDIAQDVCTQFVLGREKLRQVEVKSILSFFEPDFDRPICTDAHDTTKLKTYASTALLRTVDPEPFQDWCASHGDLVGSFIGLCEGCTALIEDHIHLAKRHIFYELPLLFGLPEWKTLKAEAKGDD